MPALEVDQAEAAKTQLTSGNKHPNLEGVYTVLLEMSDVRPIIR